MAGFLGMPLICCILSHYHRVFFTGSSSGLPPVTLGLIAANSAAFALPNGVDLWDVCLSPYCVVERREYERLATAAFVHINATHLLANLTAAVPDALFIERSRGGAALLAEVGSATALSHGLYVGAAWFAKRFLNSRDIYYSAGAVGFSSVAFALKVSTGAARAGQRVGFMGLGVPSEYAWLVSLVLTHLEVPEASFVGHMAGVVAGILRAYVLGPLLASLVPGGSDSSAARPIGRYNFGSGTVSGRPIRRAPRLFSGLRQGLGKAVKQLGLAAAVSAGFWVLKQQQQSAQRRSLR